MTQVSRIVAAALFLTCGAAAARGQTYSNMNRTATDGRPVPLAVQMAEAKRAQREAAAAARGNVIDPYTLREVRSETMFRKAIEERMKKKIKPPKHKPPVRTPNKPDQGPGHGGGNGHTDHGNGNGNGHDHHDHDGDVENGNGNANGNGNGNGNSSGNEKNDRRNDKNNGRR